MAVNSCEILDEKAPWSTEAACAVLGETSLTTATGLLAAEEAILLSKNNISRPAPGFDTNCNANSNNDNNNNNFCNLKKSLKTVNTADSQKVADRPTSSLDCDFNLHATQGNICKPTSTEKSGSVSQKLNVNCCAQSLDSATINDHSSAEVKSQEESVMRLQETSDSEHNVSGTDVENCHHLNAMQSEEVLTNNNATAVKEIPAPQKRSVSEESKEDDDQSADGENELVKDPEWTEERFRVDRRKLEQMLQAASDGKGQSGEEFFDSIMAQTNTEITWPSKLKIGAKSKKDPHIKVCGKLTDVARAKELTMRVLDTKCTRVTLKMDVSHTEHSHVIGKGGNNIKRVMEETGCHIHFPDSNRSNTAEKSNQVSIAGQPAGVENARAKIRELLPVVVSFDLALAGTIPDPNSASIQQVVQNYNVSVQFKQRPKTYCTTTCTVRGSNDNMSGLVEGTAKLMQHLAGVTTVPVTSQMEVAPQQHSYMLGRNAANVKHIMQRTGAQIRFPDPNCMPKKSTIFVTGPVEAVVNARQRLMGCLPLVLMFDMKQDENLSAADEAVKSSQLMESLDVFISIKLKPKQPSKSVIVKSVERNIYNMFEARRQLLKLETTGLKSPPPPASPPPLTLPSTSSLPNAAAPLIRLTHAPPSHLKPQYISVVPPNGFAIGPLARPSTPASPILRQNWTPSPSHSPYPAMTQQATVAAIHAQHQQNLLLQAQLTAQQQQFSVAAVASLNASRASSTAGSPPSAPPKILEHPDRNGLAGSEPTPLQMTQQFIKDNRARQQQQQHRETLVHQKSQESLRVGRESQMLASQQQQQYADDAAYLHRSVAADAWGEADVGGGGGAKHDQKDSIPSNVRGLHRHLLTMQELKEGSLSANHSFNQGNSDVSLPTHRRSISGATSHVDMDYPSISNHPRHSLPESIDAAAGKAYLPVNNGQRQRGYISSHSTPPGSDRNSPMSVLSDRISEVNVSSPDSVPKLAPIHKSPSSSASSTDLQAALRHLQNSPSRQYLHPDRAREQAAMSLSDSVKNAYISAAESNNESDLRELTDYFGRDSSPAPPPGFENFPLSTHSSLANTDYMRQKALEAMSSPPVASEVRIPTDTWSGLYFSRSMPAQEMKKLQGKEQYKQQLATTYEKEDASGYDEQEPVQTNPLAMSQNLANSSRGSSLLLSWRERNSHNLSSSLHSRAGDLNKSMPRRRTYTTFSPEYTSHNIPPPPHPNDDMIPSSQYGKDVPRSIAETPSRMQKAPAGGGSVIKNQPLEAALSLLTNHNLGGPGCVELQDVLAYLNLDKYTDVFRKQEVDLQTFLTLTESDLTELGINVFGPRKKILLAIEELKKNRNLLYGNAMNAAPGTPSLAPAQQQPDVLFHGKLGVLNHGASRPTEAPSPPSQMRGRENPAHGGLSSSRLLSHARGMVSQSGRW